MTVFWGVSALLYLNRGWTRPIWRACLATSGRDWMLNSGVLGLDAERGRSDQPSGGACPASSSFVEASGIASALLIRWCESIQEP